MSIFVGVLFISVHSLIVSFAAATFFSIVLFYSVTMNHFGWLDDHFYENLLCTFKIAGVVNIVVCVLRWLLRSCKDEGIAENETKG